LSFVRIANQAREKEDGKNARKRAENFTITHTASNLLTLIEEFNGAR
jgi:hypothetical protein